MLIFLNYFLWFIAYSLLGWVYESIVCSIGERRLVNRGFLNGPLCPIYGFGALISIFILEHRTDNVIILFFSGMVLTCAVEYITAVLLEKLFHAKWWDYSNYRFHVHGRISLIGALVFGALSVLLIKYIHPFVGGLIDRLPDWLQITLAVTTFIWVMLDLLVTVRHLLHLNKRLNEIQMALNSFLGQYAKRAGELKDSVLNKFEESNFYNERIKNLFKLNRIQNLRIVRAFPDFRSLRYNEAFQKLKDILLGGDDKS